MTSRVKSEQSGGAAFMQVRGELAMPVSPEEDDPELERTRLYPMWGPQQVYGKSWSREEQERQERVLMKADAYREQGDLRSEISLYQAVLTRRPNDLSVLYCLGRAYLEIGDAEKVIELIGAAHQAYPRLLDFQDLLLDSLFALGKDEADFEWTTELRVFQVDQGVIDRCYEYLKRKRKPRFAEELKAQFLLEGCCRFTGTELVRALAKDERFIVVDGGVLRRRERLAAVRCCDSSAEGTDDER